MTNPTALTKQNKHVQSIFSDRLMIPFLSIKMARSIILTYERVKQNMEKFSSPILIMHGKSDSVTNHEDSVKFI
jgi:alpha-beta hydrolase superfamily lysophospholipase